MRKNIWILFCGVFFLGLTTGAQQATNTRVHNYVDLALTAGQSQGSVAGAYNYNWKLWKKRKWEVGVGARWSNYFGTKTNFITAPARLARTNTTPFLIFFAGQKTENHDTLTVQRPFTSSLNVAVNIGYNFNPRWYAGFNIDVIGFTVGRTSPAILTSNGTTMTEPQAKPAAFNLLLTGDHDYGSLNSEFFLQYHLKGAWSLRAIYQFLFIEYRTKNIQQVAPDGTIVDRFRNKANNFGLGVSYHFKKQ
jgi:hypothetical protein